MVGVRISANATESRNCGAHQAQPASQASDGHPTVQMERLHVTSLKMMPMAETVAVPMITSHLKGGVFGSNELIDASARTMLDELPRWARALKPMRA